MEDDFRIGSRREPVPFLDQFVAQFNVVEDLSVEGDPERLIRDLHRLGSAGNVDDAQPA